MTSEPNAPAQGPSDSSDSGSDLIGATARRSIARETIEGGDAGGSSSIDDTTDRSGTGERISADTNDEVQDGADIGFDRIVAAGDAGLGDGLDQAEEAQLGITDEEIEALD